MDMKVWTDFFQKNWELVQHNWLYILIGLVVLFVLLNVVKTLVKWLIIVVIVVALLIYSGISLDQVRNTVTHVKDGAVGTLKNEALDMMVKEAKDAQYTSNIDGTFSVTSSNLEVTGRSDSDTVKVSFRGIPLGEWDMSDKVKQFIQSAKSGATTESSSSS